MSSTAKKGTNAPKRFGRRMRGFESASGLLRDPIRKAGESRGFAVTKLLTHWPEIAGVDLAPLCRPVKIGYGQGGMGATLTLLASGAAAPLVQMQLDRLRDKVNAIYGYAAISRIRLTQTAAEGFAEPKTAFEHGNIAPPSPQALARAKAVVDGMTSGVTDEGLKSALDRLATNVLMKRKALGPDRPGTE